MSQDQLEVMDELALEISACDNPEEREELERTERVCREMIYGLTEGLIEVEEGSEGELLYFPASA